MKAETDKDESGTNIKAALDKANTVLTNGTLTNDKKVVIFLSDGAPTTPNDPTGLVAAGDTSIGMYQENSVENIVESAKNVKKNADRVYSIGLGTEDGLSDKCAYVTKCDDPNNCKNVTHQSMNSIVPFTGVKEKEGWYPWNPSTYYHYYSEKDLAKFVLKTIGKTKYIPVAEGADTTDTTNNLSKEFDAILKDSSTTRDTAIVTNKPTELIISETATVIGDVVLSIGETSYTINIDTLKNGAYSLGTRDELSYTPGVGFTFTIKNDKTLEKELHIAYTVDKK